jgi:hypothetical protein
MAFGLFWGAWAVLPAVQVSSGATDGELGTALLMIGLGALVSMRLTGSPASLRWAFLRYSLICLPGSVNVAGGKDVPAVTWAAVTFSPSLPPIPCSS